MSDKLEILSNVHTITAVILVAMKRYGIEKVLEDLHKVVYVPDAEENMTDAVYNSYLETMKFVGGIKKLSGRTDKTD